MTNSNILEKMINMTPDIPENEREERIVLLHEYRLEQLEKNNAKRFNQILKELQDSKQLMKDAQKDLIEHSIRIEELEKKQSNFDSYIKSITVIVIAEIIIELLKFIHQQ